MAQNPNPVGDPNAQRSAPLFVNRIDRLQVLCEGAEDDALPAVPDFRVRRDFFVRRQTTISTYRRVRWYVNDFSGTQVFVQHVPAAPWLSPFKITFCPQDANGLSREEVEKFLEHFDGCRLLTIELSFDFSAASGVGYEFVRQHALFGKSRPRTWSRLAQRRFYGTRKSAKLVRCYLKPGVNAFRVELQLQHEWLRARKVQGLDDLTMLPPLIFPRHFRFGRIDWQAVEACLRRRYGSKQFGSRPIKQRPLAIHRALHFIGRNLGLVNPYRFVRTMAVTNYTRKKFGRWIRQWCEAF